MSQWKAELVSIIEKIKVEKFGPL